MYKLTKTAGTTRSSNFINQVSSAFGMRLTPWRKDSIYRTKIMTTKDKPTLVDWVLGIILYASLGVWLAFVYLATTGGLYVS